MQKIKWRSLVISVAIPLLVGSLSALLTSDSMGAFASMRQPAFTVPGWLFPIVWTILYVLMGVASYIVFESTADKETKSRALRVYFLQLVFNFFWSIIFFNLNSYGFAFLWLLVLLALVIVCTLRFYSIDKRAGALMIPYIVWVAFAGYLNLAVAILN